MPKYFSKEGLEKLRNELNHMKTVERRNIANAIAEAVDKGDLSENAEYDAAKDAQDVLEAKIANLEKTLTDAREIDESEVDDSKVLILSTVKLKNHKTNKEIEYTLVSEEESNLKKGKISVKSPIGKGLMGKKVGEIAEIEVPAGKLKFEVLDIKRNFG